MSLNPLVYVCGVKLQPARTGGTKSMFLALLTTVRWEQLDYTPAISGQVRAIRLFNGHLAVSFNHDRGWRRNVLHFGRSWTRMKSA